MGTTIRWRCFLLVVMLLANAGCERAPRKTAERNKALDALLKNRVTIINLTPKQEKQVRREIATLTSPQCTMAFINADLPSPLQLIIESGIIIRSSNDVFIYKDKDLGFVNKRVRLEYQSEFRTGRVQAATVTHMLGNTRLTDTESPVILLHVTAFAGQSYLFDRLDLHDVLVHEFIHAAGMPPMPGGLLMNDLDGYPHYRKIMRACR